MACVFYKSYVFYFMVEKYLSLLVATVMKIHERFFITQKASLKFQNFLLDLEKEYDLTYGEMFQILSLSISHLAKYLIRDERYPNDQTKKGDEAQWEDTGRS